MPLLLRSASSRTQCHHNLELMMGKTGGASALGGEGCRHLQQQTRFMVPMRCTVGVRGRHSEKCNETVQAFFRSTCSIVSGDSEWLGMLLFLRFFSAGGSGCDLDKQTVFSPRATGLRRPGTLIVSSMQPIRIYLDRNTLASNRLPFLPVYPATQAHRARLHTHSAVAHSPRQGRYSRVRA